MPTEEAITKAGGAHDDALMQLPVLRQAAFAGLGLLAAGTLASLAWQARQGGLAATPHAGDAPLT